MLNWIHKARGMIFLDADSGGKSGSGGGAGGSPNGGGVAEIADPFKDIPFDELDAGTQKILKDAQAGFKSTVATLQSDVTKSKAEQENLTKQVRDFQSRADQFKAQLDKLTGGAQPEEDDYLKAAKEVMARNKFKPEDIAAQAPVFAELLKNSLGIFKKELGRDLSPAIGSVIDTQSRESFETAVQTDDTGTMAIPEVAEDVWKRVQAFIKDNNTPATPALVLNFAKMAYIDLATELRKNSKPVPELVPVASPSGSSHMNTGYSYPGANRSGAKPIISGGPDPKAARTNMNDDTRAAVASTFKQMTRGTDLRPTILKESK